MTQAQSAFSPLAKSVATLWREAARPDRRPSVQGKQAKPEDPPLFDVIIVGSGYGASAAAAGLAGCSDGIAQRLRIAVLERGLEYEPGRFPARFSELPGHLRLGHQAQGRVGGNHEGLFDVRLGLDVNALVANGLGGGSLINAGVLLQPDPEQARSTHWQGVLQAAVEGGVFDRALKALGGQRSAGAGWVTNDITRHPAASGTQGVTKTLALKELMPLPVDGARLGLKTIRDVSFQTPPVSVAFTNESTSGNVKLNECTLCGDCMTGCNVGAKESLDTNLLVRAAHTGVEIYTGATVLRIARGKHPSSKERVWTVSVIHTNPRLQEREQGPLLLFTKHLILAAGTLGSTEILLRSRTDRLAFSPALGKQFSCNGDNIAVADGLISPAQASADEWTATKIATARGVGPTITGSLTVTPACATVRPFLVQEFAVPGALKRIYEELVTTGKFAATLPNADTSDHGGEPNRTPDPLAADLDATAKSLMLGIIGHDAAAGSVVLEPTPDPKQTGYPPAPGTVCICWPDARYGADLVAAHDAVADLMADYGTRNRSPQASLIANPAWRLLPQKLEALVAQPRGPVLTVHPLGGCPMGPDGARAVVDEYGRVFNLRQGADGDDWQGSLAVLDGSIIPESLGVNPALTICAVAMRAVDQLKRDWGLQNGAAQLPARQRPNGGHAGTPAPKTTEIEIVERLTGRAPLAAGTATPRDCVIELTLAYRPVAVHALMSTLDRGLFVDTARSRLRVFDARLWDEARLRFASERERQDAALFVADVAPLDGNTPALRLLHRERTTFSDRVCKAVRAWICNRGRRDIYAGIKGWLQSGGSDPRIARPGDQSRWAQGLISRFINYIGDVRKVASRAGEVRRFDYALRVGNVRAAAGNAAGLEDLQALLGEGGEVRGHKRLTYDRRANPWQQLTTLTLTRFPGLPSTRTGTLLLDARFLEQNELPLMRVTNQEDATQTLLDLFSFGLYMTRLLMSIHLWTFRKPDDAPGKPPAVKRLPGDLPGLPAPEIHEITLQAQGPESAPVKARLTRYRLVQGAATPPLVMIHGYSASGTSFAHPTLKPSAAKFFADVRRDVWVLDLRTSAGMPTATQPWALEQAALIDIPAALVYVHKVTGQRVDVLAHCVGAVMLSMALLTDACSVRTSQIQLGAGVFLNDQQLGVIDTFNGTPAAHRPHPTVRRVILSQKGPLLQYTDRNVFSAFVLQFVRRWVLSENYRFERAEWPSLTEELLDRFLASLPYSRREYDRENPKFDCSRLTPWTASRHRMDALYGRTFEAFNLRDETLDRIDDFFGPMNVNTLAQTIHFARTGAITNQRGRGEFVTIERMRERWSGIETMLVHGQLNGLIDVHTQHLNLDLFKRSDVPVLDHKIYPTWGHQDCLIGHDSVHMFKDIECFLNLRNTIPPARLPHDVSKPTAQLPQPNTPTADPPVLAAPWVGPILSIRAHGQRIRIACRTAPDQGIAHLVILPVRKKMIGAGGACAFRFIANRRSVPAEAGDSRNWLHVDIPTALVSGFSDTRICTIGWLVFLLYAPDQTNARLAGTQVPNLSLANPSDKQIKQSAQAWIAQHGVEAAQKLFVAQNDVNRLSALRFQHGASLRFALASCQYPGGLLDQLPAQASLRCIADAAKELDLAVFAGDQIYADATAGFADPTGRDEYFDQPEERALRAAPMRTLMRQIPVLTLLDDHEILDNWEPLSHEASAASPQRAQALQMARRSGLVAFLKHQRRLSEANTRVPNPAPVHRSAKQEYLAANKSIADGDYATHFNGVPFYLLDTRTGRAPRSCEPGADAHILSHAQRQRFEAWLLARRSMAKFVVTPSLLLPRRLRTARDASAACASDAWDGYPLAMRWLFEFMVREQVRNTVFLSGDEHHSMCATITLSGYDPCLEPVKVLCVHSSALYAPLPFANGGPADLVNTETFACGAVFAHVQTQNAPPGDGFARLKLTSPTGGVPCRLNVDFIRNGQSTGTWHDTLS